MPDSWQSASKSPHGSVLKFAELSLVCPAAGILIFFDGTDVVTLGVYVYTDRVLRSLIKQAFWKVPSLQVQPLPLIVKMCGCHNAMKAYGFFNSLQQF